MSQTNDIEPFDASSAQVNDELQRELDDALGDQSVEQLMEQSVAQPQTDAADVPDAPGAAPAEGTSVAHDGAGRAHQSDREPDDEFTRQMVRGRIAVVGSEDVFVEMSGIGGKNQGVVPAKQFDRPPRVGSIMDFVIERLDEAEGLLILSREGAVGQTTWDQLAKGDLVEARLLSRLGSVCNNARV